MGHKKWLNAFKTNDEFKVKLSKSLEKLGTPLELNAIKILRKFNYEASGGFYVDINEHGEPITREIDLIGYSKENKLKLDSKDLEIYLKSIIIAECKFSSKKDLFFFTIEDDEKKNSLLRFPVFVNGSSLVFRLLKNAITIARFEKFFDIRNYTLKMNELNVDKLEAKDNSRTIYVASSQVLSALNHYYKSNERRVNRQYTMFWNNNKLLKKMSNVSLDRFHGAFFIYFYIPMIILNEDFGLIEIIPGKDNDSSIEDLRELEYCMYLYSPNNFEKYQRILENRYSQSILVCNVQYLEKCMKKLEEGIEKIRKELQETIITQPWTILNEIDSFSKSFMDHAINTD